MASRTNAGVLAMGRGMTGKAICDGGFQRTSGEGDMEAASGFLQKVRPNQWLGFRQEKLRVG